jgi:hypothetical protein
MVKLGIGTRLESVNFRFARHSGMIRKQVDRRP